MAVEITEDAENTFLEYADPNNPVQIFIDHLIEQGYELDEVVLQQLAELNEYCIEKVEYVEQIYFDGKSILPE